MTNEIKSDTFREDKCGFSVVGSDVHAGDSTEMALLCCHGKAISIYIAPLLAACVPELRKGEAHSDTSANEDNSFRNNFR